MCDDSEDEMAYLKHGDGQRSKPETKEDWKKHYHTKEEMEKALKQPERPRQRTGGPSDYGRYYWCVKSDLSDDGEIYVMADDVRFLPSGGVVFFSMDEGTEKTRLAFAPGHWTAVYAASCLDGSAVSVEHWKGEVVR
jgi:hypothetical protein